MLPKEKIKALAKKIDDMVDWKKITGKPIIGAIMETADNWVLPEGLQYVNEKLYEKIPVKYQDDVERFIDAFIADDYQGVLDAVPESIMDIYDFKMFDADFETVWITTNWEAIVKSIKYWAEKRQKEEVGK